MGVKRVLVEKLEGFNVEAKKLLSELKLSLHIKELEEVRVINVYDIQNVDEEDFEIVKTQILSETNVDSVEVGTLELKAGEVAFRVELLPGQFDQRADSAIQCIEIVTLKEAPILTSSKIYVLNGDLTDEDIAKIKNYMINPVEAWEVSLDVPDHLDMAFETPEMVETVECFIDMDIDTLTDYKKNMGFAMTIHDLAHCQNYFRDEEKRNPTITELKVIDTYWSDHCRHTTFLTEIKAVEIEENIFNKPLVSAYDQYKATRSELYKNRVKVESLMDIATVNMKYMKETGKLTNLDISEEINACSIEVPVDVDGKIEDYLIMFKNETHNHPTEIEPFGGAATCLGGAIRDPLSGRSFVYQGMRVTGAADPRVAVEETLEGKLPQRTITREAAHGFSSYGNQIGLATGIVNEVYDDGFLAKRMEVGAVIAATPKEEVVREVPVAGDIVVLVGGRTGRDGIGGATGSSKEHDEDSILSCGAEVQKGNAPAERKLQRLYRIPELSKMIRRCNDFGAGGVSVAIGELADSLEIDLNVVKKKYEGLDGTELAISESQERMAVVIDPKDLEAFMGYCDAENLEATVVAEVKDHGRLIMKWRDTEILNLSRAFLDTNGVKGETSIKVMSPGEKSFFEAGISKVSGLEISDALNKTLSDLNVCSQKGLIEMFDQSIGSNTVLMPFGGQFENTPIQTMIAKVPLIKGETNTGTFMSHGYDPEIGKWSPYHGGMYAVVDSVAKIVASGGDYKEVRLSLQEYFERLGTNPEKWGKPFSALLGAATAQYGFETAAIGGKDSMSGTFKDIHVPPTLISFAVAPGDVRHAISPEFKNVGSKVYVYRADRDNTESVDFDQLKANYQKIHDMIVAGDIVSAYAVGKGGLVSAITKMTLGNKIGVDLAGTTESLFSEDYGSICFEYVGDEVLDYELVGKTIQDKNLVVNGTAIELVSLEKTWEEPLSEVFPIKVDIDEDVKTFEYTDRLKDKSDNPVDVPKVLIPVFPGTNCEYDTARAFERAGAETEIVVFRNLDSKQVAESIDKMVAAIEKAQIIAIPGGFSAGDEPEGSAKFIASVFRNPKMTDAVMKHLNEKDGLIIGICNGFQALVKLGLLPYGEIRALDQDSPTLTFNKIGRHVAKVAPVRVSSVQSPWMAQAEVGQVYQTAFSHGEGRFVANDAWVEKMAAAGQIATQYVDFDGKVSNDGQFNVNGSVHAIEGITSPCGRVFGKMGHIERTGDNVYKNIIGNKTFEVFKAGVDYFKK